MENVLATQAGMSTGPGEMMGNAGPGMLAGLRVIEIADERAEYAGLLLAGLGAEVIKIEPPEGNATRRIGPFLDDEPGLERSLFFWNYNRNKKSVVLDLRDKAGQEQMLRLLGGADILLDSSCGALNEALGLDHAALNARFPQLVTAHRHVELSVFSERNGEGGVGARESRGTTPCAAEYLLSPVVQLWHGGAGLPNQLR